jgi:anti-sigma regulatory factor (Ser/Thr protein kinase)
MGKVSSDFLKEMRPSYCGDASYSRSYPWCKKEPKEVNLTAYKDSEKYWDILPLHTNDAVKFCRHFQSSIFGDAEKHCVALTKDFRGEIKKIIAAMPSKDTVVAKDAKSVIPTESKLYGMITDGTDSSALSVSTIFDRPYVKKARLIREKLVEIAALKRSGDPATDSKILKLERDIKRVCIVSNPDALTSINDDCAGVIENHDSMKGWYQKGAAAIGTLFTTFVILVKTGALPKMWSAGKNQWKKARAGDIENGVKPDNFAWAGIKAIGAFFVARDPYVDPTNPLQGALSLPEDVVLDPMDDFNEEPLSNADLQAMLDTDVDANGVSVAAVDPTSLYSYGGSAEALDACLAGLATVIADISLLTEAIESAGNNYFVVQNSNFNLSSFSEINGYLAEALDSSLGNTSNTRFATLLTQVNSERTLEIIDTMNDHHTKWVFDFLMPLFVDRFKKLGTAILENNEGDIQKYRAETNGAIDQLRTINKRYANFNHTFYTIVNEARKNTSFANPKDAAQLGTLGQSLMYGRGLGHDINNILSTVMGISQLLESTKSLDKIGRYLDIIEEFDLSRLDYNVKTAMNIQTPFAKELGVDLILSKDIPKLENMPDKMRHFVFRAVNELVLNAIKYSDRSKDERTVRIGAVSHGDGLVDIIVEDNGMGIRNTTKVLDFGHRELPDLAEGTGTGLSAVFDLANRVGVTLSIESTPGKGTTITLKNIETSSWVKPTPTSGGTPMSGSPSSGGPVASSGSAVSMESESFAGIIPENELGLPQHDMLADDDPDAFDMSTSAYTGWGQKSGAVVPVVVGGMGITTPTAGKMPVK